MSKVRSSSIRIVPEPPRVPCVNSESPHVEKRPQRNAAPSRAQRIVADIARQITPLVDRALSGVDPPTRIMDFTRAGYSDGVVVFVTVAPKVAR